MRWVGNGGAQLLRQAPRHATPCSKPGSAGAQRAGWALPPTAGVLVVGAGWRWAQVWGVRGGSREVASAVNGDGKPKSVLGRHVQRTGEASSTSSSPRPTASEWHQHAVMGCGASTVAPEPPNPTADASGKKARTRRASVEVMIDTTSTTQTGSNGKKGRVRRSSVEQVRQRVLIRALTFVLKQQCRACLLYHRPWLLSCQVV